MSKTYKISLKFSMGGRGISMNSFFWQDNNPFPYSDDQVRDKSSAWIEAMYGPLRTSMSNSYDFVSCLVDEISEATGEVIRNLGAITPACDGTSAGDILPGPDAASVMARTSIAKVRGGKRLGGIVETLTASGVFNNTIMPLLVQFATQWLLGTELQPFASTGVWSSKMADFVPFADTAVVTNVPGTQVTRKPGRGA